jgi:hypothetical protein
MARMLRFRFIGRRAVKRQPTTGGRISASRGARRPYQERRVTMASTPIQATDEITIQAPVGEVWPVLADVEGYPRWWPRSLGVRVWSTGGEVLGTEVEMRPSGGRSFVCRVEAVEVPTRIRMRYGGGFIEGFGEWATGAAGRADPGQLPARSPGARLAGVLPGQGDESGRRAFPLHAGSPEKPQACAGSEPASNERGTVAVLYRPSSHPHETCCPRFSFIRFRRHRRCVGRLDADTGGAGLEAPVSPCQKAPRPRAAFLPG